VSGFQPQHIKRLKLSKLNLAKT